MQLVWRPEKTLYHTVLARMVYRAPNVTPRVAVLVTADAGK